MLQNSFVLSALNAILLLSSLRQFMKNNAVAGMSTFLSKNLVGIYYDTVKFYDSVPLPSLIDWALGLEFEPAVLAMAAA